MLSHLNTFFPRQSNFRIQYNFSKMFCFQCEQTMDGKGCTVKGKCGKSAEVSALQDLLVAQLKHLNSIVHHAKENDVKPVTTYSDHFNLEGLFATLTNVNFDEKRFQKYLEKGEKLIEFYLKNGGEKLKSVLHENGIQTADFSYSKPLKDLIKTGKEYQLDLTEEKRPVIFTKELIMYGLKGGAAYLDHARLLGYEDTSLYHYLSESLQKLSLPVSEFTLESLLEFALQTGNWNLSCMELLNRANTESYGHPEITTVSTTPVDGKCILVSGHDLRDLKLLLEQTEGKGVNVYTHGEMLPGNAYPELKKYSHLKGNYGGAWQDQVKEFSKFPGPILMTTNCLIPPPKNYSKRVFTRSSVGFSNLKHIENDDFSEIIKMAKKQKGFKNTKKLALKDIIVGFGMNQTLALADLIIDAVKEGAIKHFFLIGGCDGAEKERNYFEKLAEKTPKDTVILTLACGKYRFNKKDLGVIEFKGNKIPRVLDVGQCNDAYSAIQIALALANAFDTDVNSLPLSFAVSWFEQKAVSILLTLLHLGIKNIFLGPALPAFLEPSVLDVLVKLFGIRPIGDVDEDLKLMLKK
ncbi:hydroxylamine reductase [Anaeramoeba flamelloides]|uniref:Hydroxylamine reductase n=1 Tax=Anaeramoeba flamelloides TaxID=1746091 RepID=A0ABQ8X3F5_9EUKA|nr:hydroxylamine reductase [Anaeramoeba flamelloides]